MKNFNIVFVIFIMISFSYQTDLSSMADNYFEGNWLMYGYGCDGKEPKVEKMKAHMEGNVMVAIKTLGDNCVTTGTETFRGTVALPLEIGKNIAITYVVGNARKPNSGHWNNSCQIVDQNKFVSQKRIYIRDSETNLRENPPAPMPAPVPAPVAPVPTHVTLPGLTRPAHQIYVYYYNNYFLGLWNVIGYVCDKNTPKIETVKIDFQTIGTVQEIVARKTIGDACVAAGSISFAGMMQTKLYQGLKFTVHFMIGSPEKPSAKREDYILEIVDLNTFRIGTHTYYRNMGPGNAQPNGVYINMTPMIGHGGVYPGPGYVKLNPRHNMRAPVRRFVIIEEETNKPGNC
jgi:hypothetical protein